MEGVYCRTSILFVLTAVFGLVCGQDCLLNRVDILPCQARTGTSLPQQNQYATYRTNIDNGNNGGPRCRYRTPNNNNEIIRDISTLGTEDLRLIHSPGFLTGTRYANEILVQYNIQCGANQLAFFNVTSVNLQSADCNGRCVDYVEVDRGVFGVTESCGTDTTNNQIQLERSVFTVRFRSSDTRRRPGFQAYIVCYDPMEANTPGCTEVGSNRMRRSVSWEEQASQQTGQAAAAFYRDWLDWYHQPWHGQYFRFEELAIQFGEELQYRSQVISIRRDGGELIRRIYGVNILKTLEASGKVVVYYNSAFSYSGFTIFSGPARLFVGAGKAWLQLYSFDPVGVVPTPEEAVIISSLTQELFFMLDPETDDFILDPEPTLSSMPTTQLTRPTPSPTLTTQPAEAAPSPMPTTQPSEPTPFPTFTTQPIHDDSGPAFTRVPKPFPFPFQSRGRRQTEATFSDEAIREALLNENACNAVLRTSARATLVVANRQDSTRVDAIRMELFGTMN